MSDEIERYPLDVRLLESVIDHLPIGAIVLDDDGIIQRFNRHEEQLSGLDRSQTVGKSFFSDIAPCTEDIELGPKFREGIANNNLDLEVEFSFPYPYNKVPRDVYIRAVSVDSGDDQAHVVLIEDITSRRQLEQNNADMMMGLRTMITRWRDGKSTGGDSGMAFGSQEPFEKKAIALYADVSGFAELASRTPPAELFQVVDRQLRTAIDIIGRRGGHIDQVNGHGVVGVFLREEGGERIYHDAVRAARQIVEASCSDLKLPFRIGVAEGTVYNGPIGREEFANRASVGTPLTMARALSQVARPNEVVVTETLVGRIGKGLATTELTGVSPAGVPDPGTIYTIDAIDLPKSS